MENVKQTLTIFEKLVLIQAELKAPKWQFNSFGKYKYRSTEDILEALKPVLEKYKCFVNLTDEVFTFADGKRFYVKATATIFNSEVSMHEVSQISASAYAREAEAKKGMDESQITGTASSYARKYALNGLFAIDDTKDADATNKHWKEAEVDADVDQCPFDKQPFTNLQMDAMEKAVNEWKMVVTSVEEAVAKIKNAYDLDKEYEAKVREFLQTKI